MNINFKQPKYVLPLLALPFLCLFFYVWQSTFSKPETAAQQQEGLKGSVGEVSSGVRKKELDDKLDAYRNTYKDADGYSAVNIIPKETSSNLTFKDSYTGDEKRMLDSVDHAMKAKFNAPDVSGNEQQLAAQLNRLQRKEPPRSHNPPAKERDPMDLLKMQMAYMDSLNRENDPEYKAAKQKKISAEKAALQRSSEKKLTVTRSQEAAADFNTVRPAGNDSFISAVIDENITGYAGSRLRIKLLEDLRAGGFRIPRGTFLFAQITGFSEQRVTLSVNTILSEGRILPVKLDLYDLDGLPGLYVPSSAFREFTKDLGSSSVQGVTIDGGTGGSQFLMSSVDKLFQSTSSAIASVIRKNKAKMKYNSFIYLIDTEALQNTQQSY
ncbi:conjugative transposon protein TraM [Mucilaginibacter conchicola]|uniref:Conjugative transposon protein TraM n=1 Tax=Mucilaginibacter conchicola TaxID=2303333 RepID=A0A372NQ66_9SPHI|nr:conjugative transposon protein TraM [Mucilaginibacter conchicola]RFZ91076.1 conjugative transposon protein TraM [Mucilaginibacter conchicola]